MGIFECYKQDNSLDIEIKTIEEINEKIPDEIIPTYLDENLFNINKNSKISSTNKEYKAIDILSFSKRKEKAKKLIEENNQESIIKALEYDNTSYEIILINHNINKNNNRLLDLFKENGGKTQFESLINEIIDSNNWNEDIIKTKFEAYKIKFKSRIKFNQPIEIENMPLFFYKSLIHILLYLIKFDDINAFKERLKRKRTVYNYLNIQELIKNDEYPKESSKLKIFMIILILVDDEYIAYYMLNSIYDEKENLFFYYNKIKKMVGEKYKIFFNEKDDSISLDNISFSKKNFSFKSIIFLLEKISMKNPNSNEQFLYKYEYYLEKNCILKHLDEFHQIIKKIFKSNYFATIISELFKKEQRN